MPFISYYKICRSCLKSNGARGMLMHNGDVERYKILTEYEFSNIVAEWMEDDQCEFCGSSYLEFSQLEIDHYKMYDGDKLIQHCKEVNGELFLWHIVKKNSSIQIKFGGKSNPNNLFLEECFSKTFDLVEALPDSKVIKNNYIGDFLVCYSGELAFGTNGLTYNPILQRLWCTGFDRNEISKELNKQVESFKMYDLIRKI